MIAEAYVILVDRADDETLEAVHQLVKTAATGKGWWHRYVQVWLVGGGGSATYWRDLLKPVIHSPASVLVLSLPEPSARGWSYFGPDAKARMEWIHKNYR